MSKLACILMYCLSVIGCFVATRWGPKRSLCPSLPVFLSIVRVIGWCAAIRWGPKRSLCLSLPVFLCLVFVSYVGLQPLGGVQRDLYV